MSTFDSKRRQDDSNWFTILNLSLSLFLYWVHTRSLRIICSNELTIERREKKLLVLIKKRKKKEMIWLKLDGEIWNEYKPKALIAQVPFFLDKCHKNESVRCVFVIFFHFFSSSSFAFRFNLFLFLTLYYTFGAVKAFLVIDLLDKRSKQFNVYVR